MQNAGMQNAEWGASRGLQQGHLNQAPLLPAEGIVRDGPGAPESRAGDEIPALPCRDLTGPEDGQPLGDSLHPLRVVGVVKAAMCRSMASSSSGDRVSGERWEPMRKQVDMITPP